MKTSRSTFSCLIQSTRKKIADFIIQGGTLVIAGGSVHFRVNILQCSDCGHKIKVKLDDEFPRARNVSPTKYWTWPGDLVTEMLYPAK